MSFYKIDVPCKPIFVVVLGGLGLQEEKPKIKGYEPGYGAVDKKALIATGKTDTDSVSLPAFLGDFVLNKGIGLGIGK